VRALHRHGPLGDVHLAAAAFAALLASGAYGHEGRGIDLLGVLAAAAATAPLLVRRRYPVPVLALTTAGIFAILETLKATEAVALAPMIALYTVAATGPRNRAFRAAGALAAVAVLALAIYSPHPVLHEETVKNLALVALPVALGVGVRDRRRYIAAIHERAERAEATREEEALRRVEQERLRIAREVHDVVAHAMVAINVQAGVAAHVIDRRPEAARSALTEIKRVSGAALADLRATLGVLREADAPAPVRPAQGLDALEELAARVRAAGIDVTIDARLEGEHCPPIPSALEGAAYRIAQEALTNVLRHAGARSATLRVLLGPAALELEILDDGAGVSAASDGGGHGVRGMRERAAAVGGSVDAGPREEGGWRVHARLPMPVAGRVVA
jgi:signal transduction histidine kinase